MRNSQSSRRTVLKSLGATLALPWLESSKIYANEAAPAPAGMPKRFACLFFGDGISAPEWNFSGQGSDIKLSKALESLENIKHKLTFIDGLKCPHSGGHATGAAAILSGTKPLRGREIRGATSFDQMLAKRIGSQTMLPSMVLSCERPVSGFHESGNSMVYASHVSWSSPTSPVPAEQHPSLAFDSLFASKNKSHLSILDHVNDQLKNVSGKVSNSDRRRIDEYTNSVREVEQRIERMNEHAKKGLANSKVDMPRPADAMPSDIEEHSRLMMDIISFAFQTDRTRIATLLLTNNLSGQLYPFLGVKGDHHGHSHNNGAENYRKIVRFWVKQYNYLLTKLDNMSEGENSVLDNSCIMLVNEQWVAHSNDKVPVILGGGLGGSMQTGRTITYAKAKGKGKGNYKSFASLLLNIGHKMDVPLKRIGIGQVPLEGI